MIIAVDPGAAGGIAWEHEGTVEACKMPDTTTALVDLLRKLRDIHGTQNTPPSLIAEKVGGHVGMRRVPKKMFCPLCNRSFPYVDMQGDPGSTMFKFGANTGRIEGVAVALGFRYDTIPPKNWQTCVGMHKARGESKTAWKNRLKDQAKKFYPRVTVTLSTADALLILDATRRIYYTLSRNGGER